MKARPILMSAPMVRALLEGRKTQTRRVIKPQPRSKYGTLPKDAQAIQPYEDHPDLWAIQSDGEGVCQYQSRVPFSKADAIEYFRERCPDGQPGDLVWVRETFRYYDRADECPHDDWCNCAPSGTPVYRADDPYPDDGDDKWKPSIHMPRRASRLTLELTEVRVERLQDISEEDAQAEGADPIDRCNDPGLSNAHRIDFSGSKSYVLGFRKLWKSINGSESWDTNPWVWVLVFTVHRQNVDDILKQAA